MFSCSLKQFLINVCNKLHFCLYTTFEWPYSDDVLLAICLLNVFCKVHCFKLMEWLYFVRVMPYF